MFTIPGRLPGLNEVINAARHNRFIGAHQKKKVTQDIAWLLASYKAPVFKRPVAVGIKWIEPNGRRDRDNVQSGSKFILDGLQMAGVIKNDSRKHVKDVKHDTNEVDKMNPRIEVTITDEI